jgi:hypothetical protein
MAGLSRDSSCLVRLWVARSQVPFARRLALPLQAARNIGRLMEHGDDHGRLFGAVGNPISPHLHPSPARPRKVRVGARRGQFGGGVGGDALPRRFQRNGKGADRLVVSQFEWAS